MRLCGVDKSVTELNFSELPPLQETIHLHFSDEVLTLTKDDDRAIPLLEDVMKALPDVPFNMELKNTTDELKDKVLRLIK